MAPNQFNDDDTVAVEMEEVSDDKIEHDPQPINGRPRMSTFRVMEEQLLLSFHHLSYTVNLDIGIRKRVRGMCCGGDEVPTRKVILDDLSGEFRSGRLVAIMGGSGSGKTSLLNILARRYTAGVKGNMTVNGVTVSKKQFRDLSGYVMQDDVLLPTMTLREVLIFAARLKLPKSMLDSEKQARVDNVIKTLGLKRSENTLIGQPGAVRTQRSYTRTAGGGLSGGEKRRLSMGVELVLDPKIMFLDEPTSGLDSFAAEEIICTLKELAGMGRVVISTIHQPSSAVYHLFDDVLILSEGKLVYQGCAKKALNYFNDIGLPCPVHYNPAEHFLNVTASAAYKKYDDADKDAQQSCIDQMDMLFRNYNEKIRPRYEKDANDSSSEDDLIDDPLTIEHEKGVNAFVEFFLLAQRAWLVMIRDDMRTKARFGQTLVFALLLGVLFLQVGNDQEDIQNRNGSLFFLIINQGFIGMMGVLVLFQMERVVFLREKADGLYGTVTYFLGKCLAELPLDIFFPFVAMTVCYWMIGYQADAEKYFIAVSTVVLITLAAISIGLIASTMCSTPQVATAVGPVLLIPLILVSGFFINGDSVPDYLIWLEYISPFAYGYEIMIVNEYRGLNFNCNDDIVENTTRTFSSPLRTATSYVIDMMMTRQRPPIGMNDTDVMMMTTDSNTTDLIFNSTDMDTGGGIFNGTDSDLPLCGEPCFRTGEEVIRSLGMEDVSITENFLIMLGLIIGFRMISLITLKLVSRGASGA